MEKKENYNFLDITFSLKELLYGVSSLVGVSILTYQHNLIYLQNKQIARLSQKLDELNIQHDTLISSINSLKEMLRKRDLEFENLKNTIENLSPSEERFFAASDLFVIKALTEKYDFYLNAVKVVGGAFCVVGVVWLGFWFVGSVSSPWETMENTAKGIAQKFGYWNDVETYYRIYESIYWKIMIINKKDVSVEAKYGGSGEYRDVFSMFNEFLDRFSDHSGNTGGGGTTQSFQQPIIDLTSNTVAAVQQPVIEVTSNIVSQEAASIDAAIAVINSLPF